MNVFDENKINQLPPICGKKINHEIKLLGKKTNGLLGPVIQYVKNEFLVLKKTLTDYLNKNFIRINNSPVETRVFFVKKPGGGLRFYVDYRGVMG